MDKFFNPKSVAIFGVSESPANMAARITGNLVEFGFKGEIHQIGMKEGSLLGKKIYQSVLDIPGDIDLAVILTPAKTVPGIMEDCGKKGIKHVIVETAGFREYGEEGKKLEEKIVAAAKKHGIRFVGPNCIGTMSLHSGLATSFVSFKNTFKKGGISIVTQSGGVGFSYLTVLESKSLGLSKFASIGNKLNVDENDLLEYFMDDPETEIICMYLEGISNGRRLMELAEKTKKPILVQKANIGTLANSLAKSHTAALSSDDAVVSAALKQCGIARISDRESLVSTLKILPVPRMKGNRLAIISRSGGHAIVAADACEALCFELAPLKESFLRKIEKHLRGNVIKLTNPIDIGDLFDYDMFAGLIEETLKEPYVDGVVFMHAYFSVIEGEPSRTLFNKLAELSYKYDKPVGICVATDTNEFHNLRRDIEYPLFSVPSAVIRSLAESRDFYFRQVRKEKEEIPLKKRKPAAAEKIIKNCLRAKRSPLLQEGMEIFKSYGIPVLASASAKNEEEAVKAANKIGYPVVIKLISKDISHKTDFGGVKLNLKNADGVREAYHEMMKDLKKKAPTAKADGVMVQPMVKKGWELILGAKQDPNFGPIVLAGLGGIFVEIFKDSSIRVVPLKRGDASEMLTELKGYKILKGARGDKPYDIAAVEEAILNLSRLIEDFPEIKEIDINPFYVLHKGKGGFALDARIIL